MRRRLLVLLGVLAVSLSVYETERNLFEKWQAKFERWRTGKEDGTIQVWEREPFSLKLGGPFESVVPGDNKAKMRQVTLGVPFSSAPQGCEFLYVAAVAKFPSAVPEGRVLYTPEERRILRFLYDYKNLRCESKDLSIPLDGAPLAVEFQLIQVELGEEKVKERALAEGLRLRLQQGKAEAEVFSPTDNPLFLPKQREWNRENFRSADLLPDEVRAEFGPLQNFPKLLRAELQLRIEQCRTEKRCPPILASISNVYQDDILALFAEAERVGMPVELIVNAHGALRWPGKHAPASYSPWMWMNGNRERGIFKGLLQMHSKFVVIGDEKVLSSNSNVSILDEFSSRGLTLIYTKPEIVRMFQAAQGMIRTGIFYPVQIDRRKSFSLLLSAERPKRYVSASRRAYAGIRTEDGVESSAYGVVLDTFHEEPGTLRLSMTPVTDACFQYERKLCLNSELDERAERGTLRLGVTAYHYLEAPNEQEIPGSSLWWASERLPKEVEWKHERSPARNVFEKFPQAVDVYAGLSWKNPVHHERIALIEPDILLSGSANFVFPFSLNTVEMLRVPKLALQVSQEMDSYEDPYLVMPGITDPDPNSPQLPGCYFALEHSLGKPFPSQQKTFRKADLLAALKDQAVEFEENNLRLQLLSDTWWKPPFLKEAISETELTETFQSWSSSICVLNKANNHRSIVILPPPK